ncbi:UNVERIFIED_CONTAM: hypothetical protein KB579_08900 [Streptococcus canis]|nr:hypothetical protein [Streptococcus dysgalactiae subsp. equisimilis]HEL0756569.1 hypothetical protein [Streptococcus equi subsp. zooepidemicus]HEL1155395.1 hypothetical protein [Streptococcus equi subsp. zooepidemicus]HEN6652930.1 hypothetical protein [Streptococcus agalactiae]
MKHYFNKFNLINCSLFVLLVTAFIERLTWFLIVQMHLTSFLATALFIFALRLIMILAAALLFFTVIIEFANRNAEFDYFSNSIKSYIATWKIRRYCTQINVEPSLEESIRYLNTKQLIIKKANHSLLTLVVTYYDKKAIAMWQLPANSESQALMKELLPTVKNELNQFDSNYMFTDFIRLPNSRIIISEATRRK